MSTAVVVPKCIQDLTDEIRRAIQMWEGDGTQLAEIVASDESLEQGAQELHARIMDLKGSAERKALRQFSPHQGVRIGALREVIEHYAQQG